MISLFCLGLREITDDIDGGRIGYPLRKWFVDQEWMPLWIAKPVILCCACMASFWGSIVYWSILLNDSDEFTGIIKDWDTYGNWILCCVSASFINTVFWVIRNRLIGLKA